MHYFVCRFTNLFVNIITDETQNGNGTADCEKIVVKIKKYINNVVNGSDLNNEDDSLI